MPKHIFEDFFHSLLAASLGVAVPVKSIENLRRRVTFQDGNVRTDYFSYTRGLKGKIFQLFLKLSRGRDTDN